MKNRQINFRIGLFIAKSGHTTLSLAISKTVHLLRHSIPNKSPHRFDSALNSILIMGESLVNMYGHVTKHFILLIAFNA